MPFLETVTAWNIRCGIAMVTTIKHKTLIKQSIAAVAALTTYVVTFVKMSVGCMAALTVPLTPDTWSCWEVMCVASPTITAVWLVLKVFWHQVVSR